jgi:hypothetical protein
VRKCVLDASDSGWGAVTGSCEHGNETSGTIKGGGGGYLDYLND